MKQRILSGLSRYQPGLAWQVDIWSDRPGTVMTFLELTDHGRRVGGGGFGGPALYPDEPINHWLGRTDNYPRFLLLRAHPTLTTITAEFTNGTSSPLTLSPPIPEYQIRVGITEVPPDTDLARLVHDGPATTSIPQTPPVVPTATGSSGWLAR